MRRRAAAGCRGEDAREAQGLWQVPRLREAWPQSPHLHHGAHTTRARDSPPSYFRASQLADNSHKCAALAAAASGKRRGGFKAAPASLPPAVSSRVSPLPPQPQPLPLPQLLAVPVPVRVRVPAAAVAAQLQSQQQQPHHGFRQYAPLALARQPEPLPHLLPYLHEQLNADRSPSPPRKRSAPLPLADLLLPPPPEKRPAAEDDLQQPPLPPSATTPPLRSADTTHGATLPFL
eukprot:TRINITY_DN2648_c0_g1_i1.p2 TRINITY_DN2648_c0_g1~~TRINITY_DN2648_c0_g1_i1.p2  ORF type:complete len:233 (-),score=52.16 TRINITY_DN2648_c0_g1_i1:60-758(-)